MYSLEIPNPLLHPYHADVASYQSLGIKQIRRHVDQFVGKGYWGPWFDPMAKENAAQLDGTKYYYSFVFPPKRYKRSSKDSPYGPIKT